MHPTSDMVSLYHVLVPTRPLGWSLKTRLKSISPATKCPSFAVSNKVSRAGFACETSPILVASVENGYATAGLPPHVAMGVHYGAYISRVGGGCSAPPIGDSSIGRTPATTTPQMPRVRRLNLFIACARWGTSCYCYKRRPTTIYNASNGRVYSVTSFLIWWMFTSERHLKLLQRLSSVVYD